MTSATEIIREEPGWFFNKCSQTPTLDKVLQIITDDPDSQCLSIRKLLYVGNIRKIFKKWDRKQYCLKELGNHKNIRTDGGAFLQWCLTCLKKPTGEGRRLIVVHIARAKGIVEEGLL